MKIKKIFKQMILITLGIILLICIATIIYLQQPQFGKLPTGKRLEQVKKSQNYRDGKFRNLKTFSMIPEGYTMAGEVWRTFFGNNPRKFPTDKIPSFKTDLKKLPNNKNFLIWFGHSSYFLQIDGKKILVDPVLMGSASPLPFGVKSFKGTEIYSANDFPNIDYVLISHDHFDHLDYRTIMALKSKIKYVICGLGVGENFEYWGFENKQIIEKDWNEIIKIDKNFTIETATAQHGSGRKFIINDNTLWMSYTINSPSQKIYIGGDSGYNNHFADIGKKYGSFDLAILDNGQYSEDWYSSIHMPPKFSLKAAKDLNAKKLFPVHSSKFVLSRHPWDEPLIKITELANKANYPLVTPMIGELVKLDDTTQTFKHWWVGVN
ncbi:MBL fold metallo-hydrolase [Chishuiella sp.]|uniref:MBL fold metallo-hydrolase n=1 Tax=Chishuiella sp. TaxID=1969467 RepID=UPI0028B2221A|nr:MBL fold metallo-hydrolase [Chishuiella sp.]